MLSQGKGGASDGFMDAQACGNPLHQRGFAGAEGAAQQQDAAGRKVLCQLRSEGMRGVVIAEVAVHTCRFATREPEASESLQIFQPNRRFQRKRLSPWWLPLSPFRLLACR